MEFSKLESHLTQLYPLKHAENWDNVGFLFGKRQAHVKSIMTCLTITPEVVTEAIKKKVSVIVSHHPFPFKKSNRFTDDTFEGQMLLDLAKAEVNIYSPHTAFDSSTNGINELLLAKFGISEFFDLIPKDGQLGAGRYGKLVKQQPLDQIIRTTKEAFKVEQLKVVGNLDKNITKIGAACGSGGDFFSAARAKGVELMVTGEASFHTCVAAKAYGISLILTGHYASERFAVEILSKVLSDKFSDLHVFSSETDTSPVYYA